MMNGYNYQDMIGRSGQNLVVSVNGKRTVFYGEKAEPSVLTLNGEETQLSDSVNTEDWIVFIPATRGKNASAMLSDVAELGKGNKVLVNGEEAKKDAPLKSGDNIVIETTEAEVKEEPVLNDGEEKTEEADSSVPAHQTGNKQGEKSRESKGKITFFLNNNPLTLPLKPDHRPYYLMDMLEYSGIDFKNVTGQVVLEVNGESGYFQQELHSRDRIMIYQVK